MKIHILRGCSVFYSIIILLNNPNHDIQVRADGT